MTDIILRLFSCVSPQICLRIWSVARLVLLFAIMLAWNARACLVAQNTSSISRQAPGTIAPFLDPNKSLLEYHLQTWSIQNGLPHGSITSASSSKDGYLWIGTEDGLVRFDGFRFTIYNTRNTPEMKNNLVRHVYSARDGSVWAATMAGLLHIKNNRVKNYTTHEGISNNITRYVKEHSTGAIWLGTVGGGVDILRYSKTQDKSHETWQNVSTKNGLASNLVWSIIEDEKSGTMFVGTQGGGLNIVSPDGKVLAHYTTQQGLLSNDVWAMALDRTGALWVGTNKGVSVWKNGALIEHFTTENGLPNNIVRAMYCDAMGTMWIGTQNGVARIHTNRRVEKFLYEHGLTNAMTWGFAEDRDGGLFITTFNGLTRLSNSTFTNYSTRHGLASSLVPSAYIQHANNAKGEHTEHIWIATERGLHKTTQERLRAPNIEPLPKIDEVHVNFATLPDGRLFSATYDGTLWQLLPTRTLIPMPGDYPIFIPTALATHGKHTILCGSIGSLDVWHKGSFRRYTKQDGLSGTGARALLTNIHDTIYVGVDGGVDVATFSEDGEMTSISRLCDTLLLPTSVRVRALYRDAHGVLWIGTFGQGVYRFEMRNSTPLVTKFTHAHGFEDDVAYSIFEDEYGRMWFAGHSGVSIAAKSELNEIAHGSRTRAHVRLLTMAHGLGSNLMLGGTGSPAVFDTNGYAWFATRGGLGRMHRDSIIAIGAVPNVILEEIHFDSIRVFPADYVQGSNLPTFPSARANRMEFQYTAPVFNDAEHLTFYSMLEGYDEEWIVSGNRRTAYYTNLPRGKTFTFRVKVRTSEGVWSKEETTFTFYIEPYFYETWWFYALCVLVLAGIVYGIFLFRLRQLRRRNELLEALVEERTARLSAANKELATTNAELAHANEFKTEMLGIVAHDLKNPLATISLGTAVVSSELESGEDTPKDKIIEINTMVNHAATRMNRLIEDLLDVTSLDMHSLTLSPSEFDVSELLKLIVQEYLPKAHAKSQTLVLHAPNTLIIHADEHRLRQVLDNIVSNAVKFSATDKEISITAAEHEQECIMRVHDGGPGFRPEDMQEMFRPFRKLSARPTGGESSTGMGLNIVKQIVELHGGTVDVRNHPEGGAELTIRLPRSLP